MNRETFHLSTGCKKCQNYEEMLRRQQVLIKDLKQRYNRLAEDSTLRQKEMGSMDRNFSKLQKENQELKAQLSKFSEMESLAEINQFEQKIMGLVNKNKQDSKTTIISMFNFLNNRKEVVHQLQAEIGDMKDIFVQFNELIREGPVDYIRTYQSINQLQTTLQDFFNKVNEDIIGKKIPEIRQIFKIHKKQLCKEVNDQYSKQMKIQYQNELLSLSKERELISCLPSQLKQIKKTCRQREDNFKGQIELLEKQIKESETVHQTVIQKYQEVLTQLSGKYNNVLEVYGRDILRPTNELKKVIQQEVTFIHEEFKKITKNCDIQSMVEQLNESIQNYIDFKKKNQDSSMEVLNKKIGEGFEEVTEKSKQTIDKIRVMIESGQTDFGETYRCIDAKIKELQSSILIQKKKGTQLELENRINCQKQYIFLLQQYNQKLQSCIKRMNTTNPASEEWVQIIKQIDQKHSYFQSQSEALKQSNEQLLSELISTKTLLSSKLKQSEEIVHLFSYFESYIKQIKMLKLEFCNYFESETNFQKELQFQTFVFSEAFAGPSSKLMKLNEKIPTFSIPKGISQSQFGAVLKQTDKNQLQRYADIRKEHEIVFTNKKTIEIRLDKLFNQIFRVHEEYLKTTVHKGGELDIKIDEKAVKNMLTCLTMKLQDSLSSIKILRQNLIKVVGDIKKEFELSNKEMKTLMVYLRGSKLEKSVVDLTKALGLNSDKMHHFNKLIFSLLQCEEPQPLPNPRQ